MAAPALRPGNPVRPENRSRSLLHVAGAFFALLMLQRLDPVGIRILAGGLFVSAWTMEVARRRIPAVNRLLMSMLQAFAHPHEHYRVNSSTWYATALLGLAFLTTPMTCALAVMVLGIGDPMAAVIGRRFGRTKLASGRSLEGSLAFVISGTLGAWGMLAVCYPAEAPMAALALAMGASLAGALAELLVRRIDDNLAIPLAAAAGAVLVGIAL